MRRSGTALAVGLGIVGVLLGGQAGAEGRWTTVRTDPDGLTVESRDVPESGMPELRLTLKTSATPEALLEAAWTLRDEGMQQKYLAERKVLSRAPTERTMFLKYEPPIIRPRLAVLREQRSNDAATGVAQMSFKRLSYTPANAKGNPFAHLRGAWRFEPDGKGATRVVYTVLIDVGGVPAWLARGPQQQAAVDTVREVISYAVKPAS